MRDVVSMNDNWMDVDVIRWERVDDPKTLSLKDKSLPHDQLE